MTKRPRRQKKADRALYASATKAEIRTDYAVGCFDEEARRMDAKWGVDRLPQLVPQDVADKYARALDSLNEAIRDADPDKAQQHAANCVRGMRKMDELAEAAGHPKADPNAYIEVADDQGGAFGILLDERFWPAVKKARPDLTLVSKREAAVALQFKKHALVREVENNFPGAEVTAIRAKEMPDDFYKRGGDEIPF